LRFEIADIQGLIYAQLGHFDIVLLTQLFLCSHFHLPKLSVRKVLACGYRLCREDLAGFGWENLLLPTTSATASQPGNLDSLLFYYIPCIIPAVETLRACLCMAEG
jgi:hypothetical protein